MNATNGAVDSSSALINSPVQEKNSFFNMVVKQLVQHHTPAEKMKALNGIKKRKRWTPEQRKKISAGVKRSYVKNPALCKKRSISMRIGMLKVWARRREEWTAKDIERHRQQCVKAGRTSWAYDVSNAEQAAKFLARRHAVSEERKTWWASLPIDVRALYIDRLLATAGVSQASRDVFEPLEHLLRESYGICIRMRHGNNEATVKVKGSNGRMHYYSIDCLVTMKDLSKCKGAGKDDDIADEKEPNDVAIANALAKIIIEFNGCAWHPNRALLSDLEWQVWKRARNNNNLQHVNMGVCEADYMYDREQERINSCIEAGFQCLVLWDKKRVGDRIVPVKAEENIRIACEFVRKVLNEAMGTSK